MSKDATKACPFCGETIKAVAVKCRYCGEFLNTAVSVPVALAAAPSPAPLPKATPQPVVPVVLEAAQVPDLLVHLVDRNLVVYEENEDGQGRYRLLETVRQYARDRLMDSAGGDEGEAARLRHREFFLALAEEAHRFFGGAQQRTWLERLETEHDNLRAALEWCLAAKDTDAQAAETGLRLAGAQGFFWSARGYIQEGLRRAEAALAKNGAEPPTVARADVLLLAAFLTYRAVGSSELRSVQARYEDALFLCREIEHRPGIIKALDMLGYLAAFRGEHEQARALYEESLALGRQIGNKSATARSLLRLADFADDPEQKRGLLEQSLALSRETGGSGLTGMVLFELASLQESQGNPRAARSFLEERLAMSRQAGDRCATALDLAYLGNFEVRQGEFGTAQTCYDESLALRREIGHVRDIGDSLLDRGMLFLEMGRLAQARADFEEALKVWLDAGGKADLERAYRSLALVSLAEGNHPEARARLMSYLERGKTLESRPVIGDALRWLARLAYAEKRWERGALLDGAADACGRASPIEYHALTKKQQQDYERDLASARDALTSEGYATAYAQGQAMTLEQAADAAVLETGAALEAEPARQE